MSNEYQLHPHYAYPENADVEAVMRFGAVKRWHMLDTVRVQTLAEHSGNVALLAYLVANTVPEMFFGPSLHVAGAALLHDTGEVFVGDIPTPTKTALRPETRTGIQAVEESTMPKPFKIFVPADVQDLIKLCDLAEGIRFIRLFGGRTTIARHAQSGLEGQFFNRIRTGRAVQ